VTFTFKISEGRVSFEAVVFYSVLLVVLVELLGRMITSPLCFPELSAEEL
jgi:hypothetical protein